MPEPFQINEAAPFTFADYVYEQDEDIIAPDYMLDDPPVPEAAASPQPEPLAPQTGDNRQTPVYVFVLVAGMLLMATALTYRHRRLITDKFGGISYGRKRTKK